jgi:superoxide dismutase, Fe-Mn family
MNMTRRTVLRTTALGATAVLVAPHLAGSVFAQAESAEGLGDYATLPALPYAVDALEPHLDALTMELHHGKHHAAYVKGLNAALAARPKFRGRTLNDLVAHWPELPADLQTAVRNHGGGHLNHSLFWPSLAPAGGEPSADFAAAVTATFGGFDALRQQLSAAAAGVFGSGWAWLSETAEGALHIETTPNQENPLTQKRRPLLGIDVWEHAYYLKYQNRRADYLGAIFNVVAWDVVSARFSASAAA